MRIILTKKEMEDSITDVSVVIVIHIKQMIMLLTNMYF